VASYYNHPHPEAFYFINSSRATTLESADLAAYLISKVSLNMTAMTMPKMNSGPTRDLVSSWFPGCSRLHGTNAKSMEWNRAHKAQMLR